jgi:hypothetical protein
MAIIAGHVRWYEEIFATPGFFAEPVLLFGFQEIGIAPRHFRRANGGGWAPLVSRWRRLSGRRDLELPEKYSAPDLAELLRREGIRDVCVLDPFDPRATLRHDMNRPVPADQHERYGTLIDIGSLEHVFDTRQAIENCLRMVRVGGTYLLHTCVKGYYRHGFHTFHPDALSQAYRLNGFEVVFCRFSAASGDPIDEPAQAEDVLVWMVGRKTRSVGDFVHPQQMGWADHYAQGGGDHRSPLARGLARTKGLILPLIPPVVVNLYRWARGRRAESLVARSLRRP